MGSSQSSVARCGGSAFRRSTGTLGLSKGELDAKCKPSGLYDSCKWEQRHIRRAVGDGKIAARLTGTESRERGSDQECPICFLHYTQINMLQCCNATICTECYLQVQEPPKSQNPPCPCPFCNHSKIVVTVAKKLDGDDVAKREEEEQMVIEATIRARKDSVSSVQSAGSSVMTPDERQSLEREMRSQSSHPIMTQIRRQEDERRDMHDREYNRRASERYPMFEREFLMRRRMDALNNLDDDAAGNSGRRAQSASQLGRPNGGFNDLFLIEAALLLSMQNDRGSSSSSRSLEAATSTSTTTSASAVENSSNDPSVRRNPLLRALMQQRSRDTETEEDADTNRHRVPSPWDYPDRNLDPLIRSGFLGEGFPSYSDDDQMAMAIAMSLREEEATQERNRTQQRLREAQEIQRRVLAEQLSEEHLQTNDTDDESNYDGENDAMNNSTSSNGESPGQIQQHLQAQE